jgi:hypothetical protein
MFLLAFLRNDNAPLSVSMFDGPEKVGMLNTLSTYIYFCFFRKNPNAKSIDKNWGYHYFC